MPSKLRSSLYHFPDELQTEDQTPSMIWGGWECSVDGALFKHSILIPQETMYNPELVDTIKLRILCLLFIEKMPQEGLEEIFSNLKYTYEYYNQPYQVTASAPAMDEFKVIMSKPYINPPFSIDEE